MRNLFGSIATVVASLFSTIPAIALVTLVSAQALAARAPEHDGFVTLENGQKLYAIHYQARAGAPTLVLVNGLTYTTKPWQAMVKTLAEGDYGILMYDPRGMGKTLEETGPAKEIIKLDQQVEDLAQLMKARGIDRADVAGLSYGGAVTLKFAVAHPEMVRNVIVMAPYVKALKSQDDYIKQQVKMHKLTKPADKRTDDELYEHYLRELIFKTYPIYEPVSKEHPWRLEAIFQMVRDARHFKAADIAKSLPKNSVHMIVAGSDQYVPAADLKEFWASLAADQKVSQINIQGSEHKLPEAVPHYLAGWVKLILDGDKRLASGKDFTGIPVLGTATSKTEKIEGLPKKVGFVPMFP